MKRNKFFFFIFILTSIFLYSCFNEKSRTITFEIYKNDEPLKNKKFEVIHRIPYTGEEKTHGIFSTNGDGKITGKHNIPAGISLYLRYKGRPVFNSSIYIDAKKANYIKRINLPKKFSL